LLLLGLTAGAATASPGDGSGTVTPTPSPTPIPPGKKTIGDRAVAIAKRYLGVPYVWAGASPKGFDCSGFTMYVYAKLGIKMPHSATDQTNVGVRVSKAQLKPGDLVFFDREGNGVGHVGMYVGSNRFIHAPHTGDVVKISSITGSYARRYVTAVRPYGVPPPIVFPVVGPVQYTDDFGAPRSGHPHAGNDIMAPRRAIAVAAESGRVKIWTHSKTAGCMLYLYGRSGTTYLYIHLNNDLGNTNDNNGKCVAGTAYAPGLVSGQTVKAGQILGFVGDSGNANGVATHLHFEVHPHDRNAVDPYRYLNRARRLLFATLPGKTFSLTIKGKVVAAADSTLTVFVRSIRAWPGGYRFGSINRRVNFNVDETSQILLGTPGLASASSPTTLASAHRNQPVSVRTLPGPPTLKAQLGRTGSLSALQIVLTATA
jgi:hypothetical protein